MNFLSIAGLPAGPAFLFVVIFKISLSEYELKRKFLSLLYDKKIFRYAKRSILLSEDGSVFLLILLYDSFLL